LESLAVGQFTRRGGHPLQRRLAETNFSFTRLSTYAEFCIYHKPVMMDDPVLSEQASGV
jgi:hypothetical protein